MIRDEEAQAHHERLQAVRGKHSGVALIYRERVRQVDEEGYNPEDDKGRAGEFITAAMLYAEDARYMIRYPGHVIARDGNPWIEDDRMGYVNRDWPWEDRYYKPGTDPERLLEKVGALIAAAIDALEKK